MHRAHDIVILTAVTDKCVDLCLQLLTTAAAVHKGTNIAIVNRHRGLGLHTRELDIVLILDRLILIISLPYCVKHVSK